MMVLLHIAIEARRGGKMVRAARQSELGELFQSAVDRGPRNSGKLLFYRGINLVNRGMVLALDQCLVNDSALNGRRNSLSLARRLKALKIEPSVRSFHKCYKVTANMS